MLSSSIRLASTPAPLDIDQGRLLDSSKSSPADDMLDELEPIVMI